MMRILRYTVPITTTYLQVSLFGGNPTPLTVAAARSSNPEGEFDLWAMDDTTDESQIVAGVWVLGTGQSLPPKLQSKLREVKFVIDLRQPYVGSVITPAGFVWHVYVTAPVDEAFKP